MGHNTAHSAPGFGDAATWPPCAGHPLDPRTEDGDDFDAEAAASLIPQAWFECMGDASTHVADVTRDLGFVPCRTGALADQMHARILDSKDACWLLVLAVNHPEWAEPAMRALRDLCKETATWANWLQACQDEHDKAVAKAAKDEAEAWAHREAA